jgi:tetratricopeptide (TPR) repeat protein
MSLKTVIEFFENETSESIISRTESLSNFTELGPPDLCLLVKQEKLPPNSSRQPKQMSSYHFVTGLDCSTSASVAAYMNSISYHLAPVEEGNSWFGGSKQPSFVVRSGTYCCWNIFRKMDTRVEVSIPGGVEAFGVDSEKDYRISLTPEMWLETYLSAMIRALNVEKDSPLFSNGFSVVFQQNNNYFQHLLAHLAIRRLNPIPNLKAEAQFLDAAKSVFLNGWTLGSGLACHTPNLVNNYLSMAIQTYFRTVKRRVKEYEFFNNFLQYDADIASILANSLISQKKEKNAFILMHKYQTMVPLKSQPLIREQGKQLWRKGKLSCACRLLKYAVDLNPSDVLAWIELSEVYLEMGDFVMCLKTLNSCPMILNQQGPIATSTSAEYFDSLYGSVFNNLIEQLNGMVAPRRRHYPINESSSIPQEILDDLQEIASSPSAGTSANVTSQSLMNDPLSFFAGGAKHKDSCDVALYKLQAALLKGFYRAAYLLMSKLAKKLGWEELLKYRSEVFVMEDEYKNMTNHPSDAEPSNAKSWRASSIINVSTFNQKRLCERWLDTLFMFLYEDLRIYTIFKTELTLSAKEKKEYIRSPIEWELLGDLCWRLHFLDDAKECWQYYVKERYSFRVWLKLLNIYLKENNILLTLAALEKLVCVLDRWKFGEFISPTSPVCIAAFELIRDHGASKIIEKIKNMKMSQRNEGILIKMFEWAEAISIGK